MKKALRWISQMLFAGAAVPLLWCVFALVESGLFQHMEARQLDLALESAGETEPPEIPGLVGRIEVPRLNISVMVVEGTDAAVLRHAAGHITGTALPGRPGNAAISAHRDTFFRPLRHIRQDDEILITTLSGHYRYRVLSTQVTNPGNVAVLEPTEPETLTLVTCYPFYYLGAAPDRFVVRAARATP